MSTSKSEDDATGEIGTEKPSLPHALYTTTSRGRCVVISSVIVLSHALFLWGQLDILWEQYTYVSVDVNASATDGIPTIPEKVIKFKFGQSAASVDKEDTQVIGSWSYGGMLNELWTYSKITAVFLFVFSAFWPHLKLVLLHLYFYVPFPSRPRQSALYWLDSVGKMSLADVCATCMLFLLLNVEADIDVGALANDASQLVSEVVPYIGDSLLEGDFLSNATQSILNDGKEWGQEKVLELSTSIFANDTPQLYQSILEAGCAEFYNGGESCEGTPFVEPSNVRRGIAGIMTKCVRIRGDKCSQCECIVNNALYNHAIPGDVIQTKPLDAASFLFAKLLAIVESGDIDFSSWFDVSGIVSLGMYITIHPAFLGFTFAVILSIAVSIVVSSVEEHDSMKRNRKASSLREALNSAGVGNDQRTQLFSNDAEGNRIGWPKRILAICFGIGLVPLVFFAIYVKMFDYSIAGLLQEVIMMQVAATQELFSIIDCVTTVNDGTGYGVCFAIVYGTMMLGVPMLRSTLLAIVSVVPMTPLWQVRLTMLSNVVGGFIGWEPFFLCILLLSTELPSLTENTVPAETCEAIGEKNLVSHLISRFGLDDTVCFVMHFDMLPAFALFVVAWACLTGFNAFAWSTVLKRYDPYGTHSEEGDNGGPYCNWRQCCYFGCFRKRQQSENDTEGNHKVEVDEEGN